MSTADPVAALDHYQKAADSGLRPVATSFGGRSLLEKEMERYAEAVAEVFRIGHGARRRDPEQASSALGGRETP